LAVDVPAGRRIRGDDMIQAVARHWEKAALAAAAVCFIAYLVYSSGADESAALGTSTRDMADRLNRILDARSASLPTADGAVRQIASAFGAPADSVPGEDWVYHAPTKITVTARPVAVASAAPRKTFRIGKPVLAAVLPETGFVRMTWEQDPADNVRIAGYHVYRRMTGEEDFRRVTTDPVKERVYTDERVPPRQDVEYAVAAVTDEAEAIRGLGLGAGGEGPRSAPKGVRTLGEFALTLRIVSRFPSNTPGGEPINLARVTVRRFMDGVWMEKDYSVRKGDRIGKTEMVNRDGRAVSVDFSTGFEVASIEPVKVTRSEKVMRPKFDPKTTRKISDE
jgi:hypothetical protein